MRSQAAMWHNTSMTRLSWVRGVVLPFFLFILPGPTASAEPRLERERCTFKPPRGDRLECLTLVVPENREQPKGREVPPKVQVLKARRSAATDPVIYLSGGPGDAPLVAQT